MDKSADARALRALAGEGSWWVREHRAACAVRCESMVQKLRDGAETRGVSGV